MITNHCVTIIIIVIMNHQSDYVPCMITMMNHYIFVPSPLGSKLWESTPHRPPVISPPSPTAQSRYAWILRDHSHHCHQLVVLWDPINHDFLSPQIWSLIIIVTTYIYIYICTYMYICIYIYILTILFFVIINQSSLPPWFFSLRWVSPWSCGLSAQATDRAHRIGQTREVHIYRLISEHTVEDAGGRGWSRVTLGQFNMSMGGLMVVSMALVIFFFDFPSGKIRAVCWKITMLTRFLSTN